MEDLKIEVEETKTYSERMKSLLILGFIFLTIFGLFLYYMPVPNRRVSDLHAFYAALGCSAGTGLALVICFDMVCAYHIRILEIKENRVHIIFTKRDKKFEIDDSIEKFGFTTRPRPFNSGLPLFLKIKYNGEFA